MLREAAWSKNISVIEDHKFHVSSANNYIPLKFWGYAQHIALSQHNSFKAFIQYA